MSEIKTKELLNDLGKFYQTLHLWSEKYLEVIEQICVILREVVASIPEDFHSYEEPFSTSDETLSNALVDVHSQEGGV